MTRFKTLLGLTFAAGAMLLGGAARASDDFIVYSPYVTEGQSEVELRAHQQFDPSAETDGERAYLIALAHSFTSWWHAEVYLGSYERDPGGPNFLQGYEFENIFQLTEQGRYWADLGVIASYGVDRPSGGKNVLEFGPLFEKRSGPIDQRLNFIWEKQLGAAADRHYEFRASYGASYQINALLAPGLEGYYRPGDDARQIGPAVDGEFTTASGNEFEYHLAYLFGLNRSAANGTLALRLEFEFN